ncbi:VWA domain-containing protein [Microbulbifer sp. 2201CG32-9]|uniref:VWA domain-containing protein n=1 Tax=Microbulbifer sp. 2201CG32-9 TaxID=3232309 RepID=UPI00345B8270
MNELSEFHFLRPLILWLLIPAALLCWKLARTLLISGQLQKVIDAELLPHLILAGGTRRPWLFALIFSLLAASIVALAGPSWRKLPTPVYSNQDALVILLDLSPSMMATDLSPNRLTRARLKILDILRQRKDGLTALVAYGGEAYVVTPLTEDTATIANLVPALSPAIMPVPGSNIEMAVEAGIQLLKDGANGRGKLLAVTDGIAEEALETVAGLVSAAGVDLSILAVGSGEGSPIPRGAGGGFITDDSGAIIISGHDARQLRRLARSGGGDFAEITVDDSDISRLFAEEETPQQAQLTEREFDQWREEGPWLVLLLLPLAALLFRRGALACALPLAFLYGLPQPSAAADWQELWLRDDQRAKQLLDAGEADKAAELFKQPQWRGTANYRSGNFPAAQEDFARGNSADSLYNLGNSLTQLGQYDQAIAAYDAALEQQPQLADAEYNRDIARKLKELQQQQDQQQQGQQQDQQGQEDQQGENQQQSAEQGARDQESQGDQQQPQQSPESQSDGSQAQQQEQSQQGEGQTGEQEQSERQAAEGESPEDRGQEPEGPQQQAGAEESPLDPETQQALDQWLRQIPDDPAGLMREKFKYESLQRRRAYRSGEWQPPENGASQRW